MRNTVPEARLDASANNATSCQAAHSSTGRLVKHKAREMLAAVGHFSTV